MDYLQAEGELYNWSLWWTDKFHIFSAKETTKLDYLQAEGNYTIGHCGGQISCISLVPKRLQNWTIYR